MKMDDETDYASPGGESSVPERANDKKIKKEPEADQNTPESIREIRDWSTELCQSVSNTSRELRLMALSLLMKYLLMLHRSGIIR